MWLSYFRSSRAPAQVCSATLSAELPAARAARPRTRHARNSQDEGFQLGMYSSGIQNQEQLQLQSEIFDQMMDERSENMREIDTLRNVEMSQRKAEHTRRLEPYQDLAASVARAAASAH